MYFFTLFGYFCKQKVDWGKRGMTRGESGGALKEWERLLEID